MADALTYLLAGLGGAVPGFAKGYGEAETERKARAKELLMEAMSMDAPATRVSALYKAANAPGTIEGWLGAKGPSEGDVGAYGKAYGSKMARARLKETLDLMRGRLRPKTAADEMAMIREVQNFDTMEDEPVPPPVTPAPPPVAQAPPIAPIAAPIAPPMAPPVVTPERRAAGWSAPGAIRDETLDGLTVGQAMGDANAERILEERRKSMVFTLPGKFPGMLAPGNIDLDSRQVLKNKDGTISTELSFSKNIGGREILLPQIINGKKVSEADAVQHFFETGEHLGAFSTPAAATAYGEQLSDRQATRYGQPPAAQPAPTTSPAPPAAAPAPEDPRKVMARRFFTPEGGLKEGAPLEMEEEVSEGLVPAGTDMWKYRKEKGKIVSLERVKDEGGKPIGTDRPHPQKGLPVTDPNTGVITQETWAEDAMGNPWPGSKRENKKIGQAKKVSGKTPPDANGNYKTFLYYDGAAEDLSNALPGTIKLQVRPKPQPPQQAPERVTPELLRRRAEAAVPPVVKSRVNPLTGKSIPNTAGEEERNRKVEKKFQELMKKHNLSLTPKAQELAAAMGFDLGDFA